MSSCRERGPAPNRSFFNTTPCTGRFRFCHRAIPSVRIGRWEVVVVKTSEMQRGFAYASRRAAEDARKIWQRGFAIASSNAVEEARKLLTTITPRKKPWNKIPRKRASSLMYQLRTEQTSKPLPYPAFRSGDALEVKMLPYKSAPKPVPIKCVPSSLQTYYLSKGILAFYR